MLALVTSDSPRDSVIFALEAITSTFDVALSLRRGNLAFAAGDSDNPRKLSVANPDGWSVAYAMLGRDGRRRVVAMKTSYKFDPGHDRSTKRYYTTITLYDDTTGAPLVIYLANGGNLLGQVPSTNTTTAQTAYQPDQILSILDQTFGIATQGIPVNGTAADPEWPSCLACAVVDRARAKAASGNWSLFERSGVCQQCFDRYCYKAS